MTLHPHAEPLSLEAMQTISEVTNPSAHHHPDSPHAAHPCCCTVRNQPAATSTHRRNLPARVRGTVADSCMHSSFRVHGRCLPGQRAEPWPVADLDRGASVGQSGTAPNRLVVQRPGRLPDLRPRKGLVAMDNRDSLRGLT